MIITYGLYIVTSQLHFNFGKWTAIVTQSTSTGENTLIRKIRLISMLSKFNRGDQSITASLQIVTKILHWKIRLSKQLKCGCRMKLRELHGMKLRLTHCGFTKSFCPKTSPVLLQMSWKVMISLNVGLSLSTSVRAYRVKSNQYL